MTDNSKPGILPALASLGSLVAALSCCLPLGTMLLAAGSATASLLSERLRPWLLAFSVASVMFAFVQTYYLRRCDFRQRRARTALLWFTGTIVFSMLVFPRFTSTLMAGHLPSFTASSQLRDFDDREFVSEFNAAADRKRIVLLLSPT